MKVIQFPSVRFSADDIEYLPSWSAGAQRAAGTRYYVIPSLVRATLGSLVTRTQGGIEYVDIARVGQRSAQIQIRKSMKGYELYYSDIEHARVISRSLRPLLNSICWIERDYGQDR